MKAIIPFWLLIAVLGINSQNGFAQGSTCAEVAPFCTDSGVTFPAGTNVPDASVTDPGNDYGCLGTQPNPAWYYLQIAEQGPISILETNSNNVDVDFALWGPFDSLEDAANQCGAYGNPIDCSYSTSDVENINIPNNQSGNVYVLLITNFSNGPTEITAVQDGGAGTTNCSILCDLNPDLDAPMWVCNGGTLNLNVTVDSIDANTTYAWTGPNGFTSTLQNPSIPNMSATTSGEYTVVVTIGDCYTDPVSATVNALNPVVLPTVNTPVCMGNDISFIVAASQVSNNTTYNWTGPNGFTGSGQLLTIPNATPNMSGSYTIVANDNGCLSEPATVDVQVSGVGVQAESLGEVCAGSGSGSAVATAANGIPPYSYVWSSGSTDSLATNLQMGTYSVVATDAANCTATATATVVIFPPFDTSITGKFDFCEGETASLDAGNFVQYLWSTNDTTATISPSEAGTYSVTVTNSDGCTGIATQVVVQNPTPMPTITGNFYVLPNSLTSLDAGSGFVSYVWSNSTSAQVANVSTGGEYSVTVTDAQACSGTATAHVVQLGVLIPNAFSPNNDQSNDLFRMIIPQNFVTSASLVIYNRWGQKVFGSSELDSAWDGTYNNQNVPNGVYAYYATATFSNGQVQIFKGNVTLLR